MATEMISLKLESGFLKEVDALVKRESYQSRTELIRSALREKIEQNRKKEYMAKLLKLKGKSKNQTSDEELELIRKKAFEELYNV